MITEVPPAADDQRPVSPVRRVDVACDRFEAAWRGGQNPRIEDSLGAAVEAERPALLRALITLEVELRQGRGEHPSPLEYRDRFPGQSAQVDAAFAETALRSGMSQPPPSRTPEDTSRSILFGLLALQSNFIDRDALLGALKSWVADRSRWPLLLEELLRVECELLQAAGTERDAEEYRRRFPDSATVVDAVFNAEQTQSATGCPPQNGPDPTTAAPVTPDGDPEPEAGTRVRYFGDYELIREIGRGGMGVVYKARQISLNRPVALKMIRSAALASDDELRRFQNEAEAVATLDHPHIVPILEVGNHGGQRYFSMKLIGGSGLDKKLGDYVVNPKASAQLLKQAAEAVHHAHQRGILHRDLKPANILLDEHGRPYVTDFGLAKRVVGDSELTYSGAILGTPAYMAPEQASGRRGAVTTSSDVYGLGAILYALLAGRAPFGGDSVEETLEQVRESSPTPLSTINPRAPRDLEVICLKCLEKEPGKRYATAGELADDLGRFLDRRPIRARPVGLLGRLARWGRRNPVPAGLLTALVVTGLSAFAAILWQWSKAEALAKSLATATSGLEKQTKSAVAAQQRAEQAGAAERWERYRSNIAAAAAALQLQNSSTARRALDAAPQEHRGWEWRHLHCQLDSARAVMAEAAPAWGDWQLPTLSPSGTQFASPDKDERTINVWDLTTGTAIGVLRGHDSPVYALAYSPDGERLASGSADKTIRLWDPAAGKQVTVLRGHEQPVAWLTYSPDGQRICSLDGEPGRLGSGRLWDTKTGRPIAVLGGPVTLLAARFMPDSRRLVVGSGRQVCLWDATAGRQIAVLGSHEHQVIHLVISSDGKWIASHGDIEDNVRLWDGASGKELSALRGSPPHFGALAFSPDGSRLGVGSAYPDTNVRLWEAATGAPIAAMPGHKNSIHWVAFSADGRRIVSASSDQTARLWDGVTGQLIAPLRGHTESVWNAVFSPDGKRVVTASADQTLRLWDAASGDLIAVLRGHKAVVWGAAFAVHGSLLVSRSGDGDSRVWDMELAERNGILRGHERFVYDVAFSPDGARAASAAWDGTARLWDVTTGRQTALLQYGHNKPEDKIVSSVAWHPDGRQLATVTRGDSIILWDLTTGKPGKVFTAPTGDWAGDVRAVFNPSGTLLASGSRDGDVRLWDVATGKLAGVLKGHRGPALDVAFHPDGNQLASVSYDETVRVWDLASGAAVKVWRGGAVSYRIAYSADGRLIAASTLGGQVHLWDAHTYQQLAVLPHGSRVFGLAFGPDSKRMATACNDNTIRLWDLATATEVCELRGHEAYVHAVAFSPDGTRLASASGDSTVRIWDTVLQSVRARPPDADPAKSGESRR